MARVPRIIHQARREEGRERRERRGDGETKFGGGGHLGLKNSRFGGLKVAKLGCFGQPF